MRAVYIMIIVLFSVFYSCITNPPELLSKNKKIILSSNPEIINNSPVQKGMLLAKTECAACHRYYSPEEYSQKEWGRIIRLHSQRLSLNEEQIAALDTYFQAESSPVR